MGNRLLATVGISVLMALAAAPSAQAASLPDVPMRPVAAVTGEHVLREVLGNVEAVEFTSHSAVVRVRTEPGAPVRPINVEFGDAVRDAQTTQARRVSESPLFALVLLLGLARHLMRSFKPKQVQDQAMAHSKDPWRVGRG